MDNHDTDKKVGRMEERSDGLREEKQYSNFQLFPYTLQIARKQWTQIRNSYYGFCLCS